MISQEEVENLLSGIESDRVERTESTSDTDKFSQAVTAFANDLPNHRLPGYLVIGAKDNGRLSGLSVTDQLLQNLAALRSDGNIQPLPVINVAKFSLRDGDVAVVEVLPSDLPPVRYKGRVWVRIGPRKGTASEQEERILTEKRVSHASTFDARPCIGSSLDDLSEDLFRTGYLRHAIAMEILKENHRSVDEQLASLRFYDTKHRCPTNAGILLFGSNPLTWMPGAYVQFLRVDGPTLASDVITEKTISGDLLTVLRDLDSLIHLNTSTRPVAVSTLREKQVADYPPTALRELVMNAIMHRSYEATGPVRLTWLSDHIEIQSPGGLYGEASPGNFPKRNSYRNPVLAEAMKTLGYVNRFGTGVLRAQKALESNGSPQAEFEFDAGYVLAKVRMP